MSNKKLITLYNHISKHSNYQIIHPSLNTILDIRNIQDINSRFEKERMKFIENIINLKNKTIVDIGGNTGFFSFASLEAKANKVVLIEGNSYHAEFVSIATSLLNYHNLIVINQYFDFESTVYEKPVDITLMMNILHHYGDDFGDNNSSRENVKNKIIEYINNLASQTSYLVLQLGFCWKGNRHELLFDSGEKKEMIKFILEGTINNWKVVKIGIAEVIDNTTTYLPLSNGNIHRNNQIGEFRNRPLFILKSLYL